MVAEVVGVDVSESMLAVAREKLPSAKFVHADLTRERPELGDFDLVTSFRFLGNAEPALRTAALRALNRQQRPGSYLIVDNHRNPMCLANWIHRVRGDAPKLDLSHRRLTNLLGACGYELVDARPIGVWQYRAKLMASAGSNPEREERLEQLFRARRLASIAPASVVVARKAQDLGPGE